jgi:uncharacterized membrane protein
LGGFFDGILLHQVLQWHHLLSSIQTGFLADLRGQVMADGLFHGAMYLVAVAGLLTLAGARTELDGQGAQRRLLAHCLIGFGFWHMLDAVLSHWILGLHRVRMDVATPLSWDIGWLLAFGVLPWVLGWRMPSEPDGDAGGASRLPAVLPGLLVASTLVGGFVSAWPLNASAGGWGGGAGGGGTVTVVLRPGVDAGAAWHGLTRGEARLVWIDPSLTVLVLQPDPRMSRWDLYRQGAMYVSGTVLPAGCAAWSRIGRGQTARL